MKREGKHALIPFLVLTILIYALMPQAFAEETEYNEVMYAAVFLSANPGEFRLVKNINLIFDRLNLPINTSITAFNNKFLNLTCTLHTETTPFFIAFDACFEPDIENETAKLYTNEIVEEFMSAFGYLNFTCSWENYIIREGKMWVYKNVNIPRIKESILTFLKFTPRDGFGKFIGGLVEKYFPGDSTTGLLPFYMLEKSGDQFHWTLIINGASSDILPSWEPHDYSFTISLKELLNANSSIVEQPLDYQHVLIRYEYNHTEQLSRGLTTYIMNVDCINPEGYAIEPDFNWRKILYDHPSPTEDITIKFTVNSYVQKGISPQFLVAAAIVALIALSALFIIVLVYYARKREGGEKRNGKEKNV